MNSAMNSGLHDLSKAQSTKIEIALNDKLITLAKVNDREYCSLLEEILDQAEAISLAKQHNALVLLDEKSGRKIAQKEGLKVVGSLFILITAKQVKYIASVIPLLEKLKQHGYYLSDSLVDKLLEASQGVFAAYLNTSKSTIHKREQGQKHPNGPSLKLLNLEDRKGLVVLA